MIKFNVNGLGEVKVKASFKGESRYCEGRHRDMPHFKFQILIETKNGKAYYTFHDSYNNWCKGKRTLGKRELCNAVDAILSDIYDYINDEIDGIYDDPKDIERVEKALKTSYNSFQRIVGDSSIDEFNDAFVEYDNNN